MNLKKDLNNIHDKGYKDLYSNKEVFLDLIQSTLKAPWAKNLKPENLILVNKSYISSDYEEKESDILYMAKINNKEVLFYVLLEFQSTVDYRMPLRLFFYISEILREYAKNADQKFYDKTLKIPAIVPLVLYNGKTPWDVPKSFKEITYNGELFGNSIVDFTYSLFDVNNNYSKDELLKNKTLTSAIFLLDQKIDPYEFLQRIKTIALFFEGLSEKDLQVLKHWIKNSIEDTLAEQAIKVLNSNKEDVENMVASNAFILTEMKENAKKEGIQKGLQEGMQEGIQKGMQKGMEELIIKMIKKGKSIDEIVDLTDLPRDMVEEIFKNINK